MKKSDAIERALMEFEKDAEGNIYEDREASTYTLQKFGERVLAFYIIPYSDTIQPLKGGKKQ